MSWQDEILKGYNNEKSIFNNMAKQNKTICLELDTIEKAKKKAKEKGLSFSAYIELLILEK